MIELLDIAGALLGVALLSFLLWIFGAGWGLLWQTIRWEHRAWKRDRQHGQE